MRSTVGVCRRRVFLNFRTRMFCRRRRAVGRDCKATNDAAEGVLAAQHRHNGQSLYGLVDCAGTAWIETRAAMGEDLSRLELSLREQDRYIRMLRCANAELRTRLGEAEERFRYEQGLLVESHESSVKRLKTEVRTSGATVETYGKYIHVLTGNLLELGEVCESLDGLVDFRGLGGEIELCSKVLSSRQRLLREVVGMAEEVDGIREVCRDMNAAYHELAKAYEEFKHRKASDFENIRSSLRNGIRELEVCMIAEMTRLVNEIIEMNRKTERMVSEAGEVLSQSAEEHRAYSVFSRRMAMAEAQVGETISLMAEYGRVSSEATAGLVRSMEAAADENEELKDGCDVLASSLERERSATKSLREELESEKLEHKLSMQALEEMRARAEKLETLNDEERAKSKFLEAQLLECDILIRRLSGGCPIPSENNVNVVLQIDKLRKRHQIELNLLNLRIEELEMLSDELKKRLGN
jgi:hypothetical protein